MAKYRITGPDGATYEITAPDDASEQDVLSYAQQNFGTPDKSPDRAPPRPDRSAGVQALRYAGLGSKGFADSALETLASPLEISGKIANAVGVSDYKPGTWTERLKSGYRGVGRAMAEPVDAAIQATMGPVDAGPAVPETGSEKFAYGAGRGAADMAAIYAPAAVMANTARTGSLAQRLGATLAEGPKMQLAAGSLGGGVAEVTDSPLAGAAAAMALPVSAAVARSIISPVENQLTPELRRLAAAAEAEGIPLSPGQQTGSKALQLTESVFNRLPMTSGASEAGRETQRQAFNRAVLQRAGINADSAGPEVLAARKQALSGRFKALAERNTVAVDDDLKQALDSIRGEYQKNLTPDIRAIVDSYVDDIIAHGDEIPGVTYQKSRSAMSRRANTATQDPEFANTLRAIRNALDDAATRSISPDDAMAWGAARKQYGNLKDIMKTMKSGTDTAIAGNIPPTQLQSTLRQGGDRYATGQGDLNDLARIGNAFVRDSQPDSGTAQRTLLQNIMTGGLTGGAGAAMLADPVTTSAVLGGSYAIPKALQYLYTRPIVEKYLTNEFLKNNPRINEILSSAALRPIAVEQANARLLPRHTTK